MTTLRRLLVLALMLVTAGLAASPPPAEAGLLDRLRERRDRKAAEEAGADMRTVTIDGEERRYFVFGGDTRSRNPGAVFVFHGGAGSGMRMAEASGFHEHANRIGAITVYPDKSGSNWNDGRETTMDLGDDLDFVSAMIDDLATNYGVDKRRLFSTGVSNGGIFTQRLACDRAGTFRAFASVVANLPARLEGRCNPSRPVPFLMINGTEDSFVRWEGGQIKAIEWLGLGAGGTVISTPDTIEHWAQNAGCSAEPRKEMLPDRDPGDGTRVTRFEWTGCKGDAEVLLYRVEGGEHGWPGSTARRVNPGYDISASEVIFEFFRRHGL